MRYESQLTKMLIGISIWIAVFFNSASYCKCNEPPIKIAIIDTGFGYQGRGAEAHLCSTGHKDFTSDQQFFKFTPSSPLIPFDTNGHGTNIAGIIESYAKKARINYCIVILKYYNPQGINNLRATIEAIEWATKLGVKYINYSSGGVDPLKREKDVIVKFLNGGGTFVTVAGNNGQDLDHGATYYPALYDKRIVVVGSLDNNGKKMPSSNFGKVVTRWEKGLQIEGYGIRQSGTSQAAAIAMGKLVSENPNKCER